MSGNPSSKGVFHAAVNDLPPPPPLKMEEKLFTPIERGDGVPQNMVNLSLLLESAKKGNVHINPEPGIAVDNISVDLTRNDSFTRTYYSLVEKVEQKIEADPQISALRAKPHWDESDRQVWQRSVAEYTRDATAEIPAFDYRSLDTYADPVTNTLKIKGPIQNTASLNDLSTDIDNKTKTLRCDCHIKSFIDGLIISQVEKDKMPQVEAVPGEYHRASVYYRATGGISGKDFFAPNSANTVGAHAFIMATNGDTIEATAGRGSEIYKISANGNTPEQLAKGRVSVTQNGTVYGGDWTKYAQHAALLSQSKDEKGNKVEGGQHIFNEKYFQDMAGRNGVKVLNSGAEGFIAYSFKTPDGKSVMHVCEKENVGTAKEGYVLVNGASLDGSSNQLASADYNDKGRNYRFTMDPKTGDLVMLEKNSHGQYAKVTSSEVTLAQPEKPAPVRPTVIETKVDVGVAPRNSEPPKPHSSAPHSTPGMSLEKIKNFEHSEKFKGFVLDNTQASGMVMFAAEMPNGKYILRAYEKGQGDNYALVANQTINPGATPVLEYKNGGKDYKFNFAVNGSDDKNPHLSISVAGGAQPFKEIAHQTGRSFDAQPTAHAPDPKPLQPPHTTPPTPDYTAHVIPPIHTAPHHSGAAPIVPHATAPVSTPPQQPPIAHPANDTENLTFGDLKKVAESTGSQLLVGSSAGKNAQANDLVMIGIHTKVEGKDHYELKAYAADKGVYKMVGYEQVTPIAGNGAQPLAQSFKDPTGDYYAFKATFDGGVIKQEIIRKPGSILPDKLHLLDPNKLGELINHSLDYRIAASPTVPHIENKPTGPLAPPPVHGTHTTVAHDHHKATPVMTPTQPPLDAAGSAALLKALQDGKPLVGEAKAQMDNVISQIMNSNPYRDAVETGKIINANGTKLGYDHTYGPQADKALQEMADAGLVNKDLAKAVREMYAGGNMKVAYDKSVAPFVPVGPKPPENAAAPPLSNNVTEKAEMVPTHSMKVADHLVFKDDTQKLAMVRPQNAPGAHGGSFNRDSAARITAAVEHMGDSAFSEGFTKQIKELLSPHKNLSGAFQESAGGGLKALQELTQKLGPVLESAAATTFRNNSGMKLG